MGHLHHAGRFVIMTTPQLTPSADEATDTEVDLSLLESLDFAIPCDIEPTGETPEHDAEVYATFSCGHGTFFCAPHASSIQEQLALCAAIGSATRTTLISCTACEAPNPTIVLIQPISALGDAGGNSGRSDHHAV
jgi:hypothetical protein